MDGGPPRAPHRRQPGARPDPRRRGRLRRDRPDPGAARSLRPRYGRLHAVRHRRPDHHVDAAARALPSAELHGRLRGRLYQQGGGLAVPRGGTPARRLCHGAHDRPDRARARARAGRGATPQLRSAGRVPLGRRTDLPGRRPHPLRQRQLSGRARDGGRDDRRRGLSPATGRGAPGRPVSRAGLRLLRRGHGDRPVRRRARARRAERQGSRRHRLDHAGAGARHDVRADRRGRDRVQSRRRLGGHRRYHQIQLGRRNVREPRPGHQRQRDPSRRDGGPREGAAPGGEPARGVAARPRARRRTRASQGRAGQGADARCPGHGREPDPLRVRKGGGRGRAEAREAARGPRAPGPRRAGARGARLLRACRRRRSPAAATPRSSRWTSTPAI